MERQTLLSSAARTATVTGAAVDSADYIGVMVFLSITAATGTTPTLVVKLQGQDELTGEWQDLVGAAFASKSATGTDSLIIYPGVTVTANRQVSSVVPHTIRAVGTIGGTTPSFTFSVSANFLK